MRKTLYLFFLIFTLFALSSCKDAVPTPKDDQSYTVMLGCDSGVKVDGTNPVKVKSGETASFKLVLESGYVFKSSDGGVYDYKTGVLTVENVTEKMYIKVKSEFLGYDTTEEVAFIFRGEDNDTTSIAPGPNIKQGTEVTVKSNTYNRIFSGWSVGGSLSNGGILLSKDREFTFRISPDIVKNGTLYIYANYKDSNVFYYDANGGTINGGSINLKENQYYTSEINGNKIKITMGEKLFSFAECPYSFWDDGTFTREGYVLIEYNTKPDGSGESYGLGSQFFTVGDDDYVTLYCIWAENTNKDSFTVENFEYKRPSAVFEQNALNWHESGVIITKYNGNEDVVVIPETIQGKPVIAIGAGAFSDLTTKKVIFSKNLLLVEDGAFTNCQYLETIYFSDGIYQMNNEALDELSYKNFKHLYVNATIAPRFINKGDGAFGVKLSRLLASYNENRVIVVSGSSSYEGLSTTYLEALLEGYTVINFGTTRTTHALIYLEAMRELAHEGDIIVYAPENSSYLFGEPELYWKTLRDLEGMYNMYRLIDISGYTNVFGAFTELNQQYKYLRKPTRYENICEKSNTDKYGDQQHPNRQDYNDITRYTDAYYITLNERVKSKFEGEWHDEEDQEANKDYKDPNNTTWCSITDTKYTTLMNHAIDAAKTSGAKVYFGFSPVDAQSIVDEAKNAEWLMAYDKLIADTYNFDGVLGSCAGHIFDRKYFYDCAFHPNDYGRTYHTYRLYLDLTEVIETERVKGIYDEGVDFNGCLFEQGSDGTPNTNVDFLKGR